MDQLDLERRKNTELTKRITELEERIHQLEKQQPAVVTLTDQMQSLAAPQNILYHGPDTVEHFNTMTLETVIGECKQLAPDVLQLLGKLGNAEAEKVDGKLLMALCALIRSRTRRALGVQLLMSFMLVARSTSTQVCYGQKRRVQLININYTINIGSELPKPSRSVYVIQYYLEVPQGAHSAVTVH